jgi:hypothetical protein
MSAASFFRPMVGSAYPVPTSTTPVILE